MLNESNQRIYDICTPVLGLILAQIYDVIISLLKTNVHKNDKRNDYFEITINLIHY